MKSGQVAWLLAYVSGWVNQQLLQNEYLVAENRILRSRLRTRVPLTNSQRMTLAEIGKRLGPAGAQPNRLHRKTRNHPGWYRKLIAKKFDGSRHRDLPGTTEDQSRSKRISSSIG